MKVNFLMRRSLSLVLFSAIVGRNCNSPFARSATSLGVSLHHGCGASHHLRLAAAPFICAEGMRNDVLALLEMMLCFAAQMKSPSLSTWTFWSGLRGSNPPPPPWQGGALPNELNPHIWCLRSESNQRHGDFQSPALPTELQRQSGDPKGTRTPDL